MIGSAGVAARAEIVAEARAWVGTRWQHQQHTKGVATDCAGMVYGVGHALGLRPALTEYPQWDRFAGLAIECQ